MRSAERLSLMIRFNHRGSLTSLDRGSRLDLYRTNSSRRNSTTIELTRARTRANSSPKIDLLKSSIELGHIHKSSNPQLNSKPPAPAPLQRHTTKVCLLYIWTHSVNLVTVKYILLPILSSDFHLVSIDKHK